jgi:hypothetical protein
MSTAIQHRVPDRAGDAYRQLEGRLAELGLSPSAASVGLRSTGARWPEPLGQEV